MEKAPFRIFNATFARYIKINSYLCTRYNTLMRIMARPIRETPVLKGEDAFRSTFGRLQGKNFEMRRLEVVLVIDRIYC